MTVGDKSNQSSNLTMVPVGADCKLCATRRDVFKPEIKAERRRYRSRAEIWPDLVPGFRNDDSSVLLRCVDHVVDRVRKGILYQLVDDMIQESPQ
jgi:hypothetical protein